MTVDFYYIPASPPCRTVLMTARYLNISLNHKYVDFKVKEHLQPDFLKINPQHTVPAIDDDGFKLWESRAIVTYLVDKYAPNSPLYPKDAQKRAIVDRMLYFDIGVLYKAALDYFRPQALFGKPADPEKEKVFRATLTTLEGLLKDSPYAAGDHLTLADISIYAGLSFANMTDFTYDTYPNISAWLQKIKSEIPDDKEINEEPLKELKEFLKTYKIEERLE